MREPLRDVRFRDLRSSYLLLGECCELGQSPHAWLQRLHRGLAHLCGVQLTILVEGDGDLVSARRSVVPADGVLSCGWPEGQSNQNARRFLRLIPRLDDPCWPSWERIGGRHVTRRRQDLASDREWYNCHTYNTFYTMSNSDHQAISRVMLDNGRHLLLQFWRERGEKPFSERDAQRFHLITGEIRCLTGAGRLVTPVEALKGPLSPRLLEVLRLIGQGLTEKEVAAELDLSPYTVHDYVKRLHRELDVSTRGELVAAALRILSLESGPPAVNERTSERREHM